MVGGHMMAYWWILVMAAIKSGGPAAKPNRQPVIAQALEKPWRSTK